MAHTFIKVLRGKNEEIALAITGFLVSIPIFADSALILLAPLVKSISQAKKKSLTGLALAMACALNITHASVPPTPGPLAVVAQFGDTIDLGAYILFGIVMGLPVMILIAIMSRVAGCWSPFTAWPAISPGRKCWTASSAASRAAAPSS